MIWRIGRVGLGALGLAMACGEAPGPPAALMGPAGAGSAASTDAEVLGNRPSSVVGAETPEPGSNDVAESLPDAGSTAPDVGPQPDDDEPEADPAPGTVYFACTESNLIGCDYIYVTAVRDEPELCVQLTLDDCEISGGRQLQVDVPRTWRLASASVRADASECEPAAFYADSTSVSSAGGSIDWNVETREPTALAIDLTLRPSRVGADAPAPITLQTSELLGPLGECGS